MSGRVGGAVRLESLTTLRFLAAALIVAGHAGQSTVFSAWKLGGIEFRQAVSFFYVLSGFILYFVYRDTAPGGRNWGRFLVARLARIWPAHILGLLAVILLLPPETVWGSTAAFLANAAMLHSLIPSEYYSLSYNDVSWSISNEAIFYLLFPFLLALLRRSAGLATMLAAGAIVSWVALAAWLHPAVEGDIHRLSMASLIYLNPFCRMAEFICGMIAARVVLSFDPRGLRRQTLFALEAMSVCLCIVMMAFCSISIPSSAPWSEAVALWIKSAGPFPAFAVLVGIFAWSDLSGKGSMTVFLSARPLVYLGEISFSLYILHRIVLRWLDTHQGALTKLHLPLNGGATYALYWAGLIAASAICHEVWEKPLRRAINGWHGRITRFAAPSRPT